MSVKFHISPTTGRPNLCRADVRACPVGGEHFATKEEAREAYERGMEQGGGALQSLKKVAGPSRADVVGLEIVHRETGEVMSYTSMGKGELAMPGYLEHVERSYEGSPWEARRVHQGQDSSFVKTAEPDPVDVHSRTEWCDVCGRATDHTGEHDGLVEAGMAEYRDGEVWKTETYDPTLARKIADAEYSYYSNRREREADTPEVTRLREELEKLENSPARHQYGFPEDEMVRYNIEQAIKAKREEIKALQPSYDPKAEQAALDSEKGLNNAIATARFQAGPKAYKPFSTYKTPEPGRTVTLYSTAVAHVQYNKVNPGVTPRSVEEMGTRSLLIPNMGRMTSGRMLTIANELARLGDKNLEEWDAMPAAARIRWAESHVGKPRDVELQVQDNGRLSWSSKYSSSGNYPAEDVVIAKYPA